MGESAATTFWRSVNSRKAFLLRIQYYFSTKRLLLETLRYRHKRNKLDWSSVVKSKVSGAIKYFSRRMLPFALA